MYLTLKIFIISTNLYSLNGYFPFIEYKRTVYVMMQVSTIDRTENLNLQEF